MRAICSPTPSAGAKLREGEKMFEKKKAREGFNVEQYQEILDAYRVHELIGDPPRIFRFSIGIDSLDSTAYERLEIQGFYYDFAHQCIRHK